MLKDLQERLSKGEVALSIEVMDFLKDWLTGHIVEHDKKYGVYINEKRGMGS